MTRAKNTATQKSATQKSATQKPANAGAEKRTAFKHWFDGEAAKKMGAQIAPFITPAARRRFVRLASRELEALEMHGRVHQFADALADVLPDDANDALRVLTQSLPEILPDCDSVTDGWLQWPTGQFIADRAAEADLDVAMDAMIELTQRFSSEFAVRPYVEAQPEELCERLLALTSHSSPHVRRWCSEGVRPRLPWGAVLRDFVAEPGPIWPILDALKDDPEIYVRKSVANTINDISKDHPAAVIKRLKTWAKGASDERAWLIKHALRGLIKAGDPGALSVVGYRPPKTLEATLRCIPKRVALGSSVTLEAELDTGHSRAQPMLVDYVVHYVRKKGTSEKVFKWTTTELSARGSLSLTKKHAMKATTIRALYPGEHRVELQVNGARVAASKFVFEG